MALSVVRVLAVVLSALVITYVAFELLRPDILLVGNVTVDVLHAGATQSTNRPGGSVTYAAAVAAGLKKRSCLVTAARSDEDLSYLEGVDLHVVPSDETLTFEHTYTWFGNQRQLRVTGKPGDKLSASHVPWQCRTARIVLLGPLVQNDVDVADRKSVV